MDVRGVGEEQSPGTLLQSVQSVEEGARTLVTIQANGPLPMPTYDLVEDRPDLPRPYGREARDNRDASDTGGWRRHTRARRTALSRSDVTRVVLDLTRRETYHVTPMNVIFGTNPNPGRPCLPAGSAGVPGAPGARTGPAPVAPPADPARSRAERPSRGRDQASAPCAGRKFPAFGAAFGNGRPAAPGSAPPTPIRDAAIAPRAPSAVDDAGAGTTGASGAGA